MAAVAVAVAISLGVGATLAACSSDEGDSSAPTLSAAGKRGQAVAQAKGCVVCHSPNGASSTGPTWKDLAGSEVELAEGGPTTADDAYLRRSMTKPHADVVEGYADIMPTTALTDEQVTDLLAYLHDLAPKGS